MTKKFYVHLYIDGAKKKAWLLGPLKKNRYWSYEGFYIGGLNPGRHQLKIIADKPNRILEIKETDNSFTRTIRVY